MKRIVFWATLLILFSTSSRAQWKYEEYTNVLNGAASPLKTGDTLTVNDTLLLAPAAKPAVIATNDITNIVAFGFNEVAQLGTTQLPDTFSITVNTSIGVLQSAGGAVSSTTRNFTISYSKNNPYRRSDVFYFNNGRRVKVQITGISVYNINADVAKAIVLLTNDLRIDRSYTVDCADCGVGAFNSYVNSVADARDTLMVSWPANKWAKAYDLEWTYISNEAYTDNRYGVPGTAAFAQNIFRNNASRVTIASLSYNIPLLFNSNGYVFFRYRAVQQMLNSERITSKWSPEYNLTTGLGQAYFTGHEINLNWQASTTFAEEGKLKSVVSYYDGTLKNRQSVTKDNITRTTIVEESLYDHQGRRVIAVLPAPTLNNIIQFTPLLSRDLNTPGSEYTKDLYDGLAATSDYCNGAAPGIATDTGASKYFSPQNPLKQNGFNKYIPDAENFPFAETKYTQDNTGRIAAQGQVGKAFRLGTTHDTKYYYASPSQTDLDALFGTDAGDAAHYQKNMVRDANGQYSVSYIDMKGHIVAAALAGDPPASLSALSSYQFTNQTETLLTPVNNIAKDNSIVFSRTIAAPRSGSYSFTYTLSPQTLQLANWQNQQICYDCLYDLTITIADECNNQSMPGGTAYVYRKSNFSLSSINSNCADPARGLSESFSITLNEGSYVVTKELSISQPGKNYYRDNIYMPNNSKTTFDDIYKQQMQLVKTQLGDCSTNGNITKTDYDDINNFGDLMLAQMTDGGVYAQRYKAFYDVYSQVFGNNPAFLRFIMLTVHPEYSVYANYTQLTASNKWDDAMRAVNTYQAAVQGGYLNALQLTTAPANRFPSTNPDPFFQSYSGYKARMTDSLKKAMVTSVITLLGHPIPTAWADLYSLSNMMVKCDVQANGLMQASCITQYNNATNVFNSSLLCETELDKAWNIYKTIYLNKKKMMTSDFLFSLNYPVLENENYRIFVDPRKYLNITGLGVNPYETDPVKLQQQGNVVLANAINDNCRNYAAYWWNKLSEAGCGFQKDRDSAAVINRLIAVCKEGGDASHPLGASTVKPGSTSAFKSFNDAIVDYVRNTPGVSQDITLCNGVLIDAPGSYEKPFIAIYEPVSDKPTACECKNITGLYQVYQASYSTKYTSMSSFMQAVYKTTISNGALDSLRRMCNNEFNCIKVSNNPVVLPPVFQCGNVQSVCADCQKVNNAYIAFTQAYPAVTVTKNEDTARRNVFFAGFMNDKTGLGKTATDYLSFIDLCNSTPGSYAGSINVGGGSNCNKDTLTMPSTGVAKPSAIACADLIKYYQNFIAEFPNHTKGATVRMYINGGVLTLNKGTDDNSVAIGRGGPDVPELVTDTITPPANKHFVTALVSTGAWVDSVMNGKQLFEWYMNQHFQLSYTYQQYADWLINSCGYKLYRLPWSDTVAVRQDTLLNIWNRFAARYPASQLTITETVSVPVMKGIWSDTRGVTDSYSPEYLTAMTWTSGPWYVNRSATTYNLSVLPKNSTIQSAALSLFAFKPSYSFAPHFRYVSQFPFMQILQVKGLYIPGKSAPGIQPDYYTGVPGYNLGYVTANQVSSGSSTDFWSAQDFPVQNVQSLVSTMYSNMQSTGVNYPVQYRLNDESSVYKQYEFGGTECSDLTKRPTLSVAYSASRCDVFAAFVNKALGTYMNASDLKDLYAAKGKMVIDANCVSYTVGAGCGTDSVIKIYASDLLLCGNSTTATFVPLSLSMLPDACKDSVAMAWSVAQEIYNFRKDSLLGNFDNAYTQKCLSAASFEGLTMTSQISEYHYTLYYYDQAGNLVKTVPPAGVALNRDPTWLDQVKQKRAAGLAQTPLHTKYTLYRYNSQNQVVSQYTPDGGEINWWYDRLGRPAVSRNEEQKKTSLYSYTLYDVLGRIVEVGQKPQPNGITDAIARNTTLLDSWINLTNVTYPQTQVTRTQYDKAATISQVYTQFNQKAYTLRNRISYVQLFGQLQYSNNVPTYLNPDQTTYYNYDIHGNVDTLLHDYATGAMAANGYNRFKLIAYGYDLVSGRVTLVSYQPGKQDEMYHRYEYDAENRITDVYTTHRKAFVGDRNVEEKDAEYSYYKHGPVARMELGTNKVQGVDYAYTLQGWLKGVNSTALNPAYDQGADGNNTARDVFGFSLNYFQGDYKAVNTTVLPFAEAGAYLGTAYKPLYNGNISNVSVGIKGLQTMLYNYQYDQLHRLTAMNASVGFDSLSNQWSGRTAANKYGEAITYDANGNILTYNRDGNNPASLAMDRLHYNYVAGTNKPDYITDDVADGIYSVDEDSQAAGNYSYDAIGNLTGDVKNGINSITWTTYGKIKQVTKSNGTIINYTYDALGKRISKTISGTPDGTVTTWYVADAHGSTLATYTVNAAGITVNEQFVYGSSRLGVKNRNLTLNSSLSISSSTLPGIGVAYDDELMRGKTRYELSNHLGNVMATISDRKVPHITGGTIDYYEAEVISAQDYYPFGMLLPGRNYNTEGYRYGFNGKEKSNEISGDDYDFGARIYDGRIGRWLSTDPLQTNYPSLTPYNYCANNPIMFYDADGKVIIIHYTDANGRPASFKYTPGIKPATSNAFVQQVHEAVTAVMKNDAAKTFQGLSTNKNIVNIKETTAFKGADFDHTQVVGGSSKIVKNPAGVTISESIASIEQTISWNPIAGLKTISGGAFAPSTALLHEAGHATINLTATTQKELVDINAPTHDAFDTKSDKQIITGLESDYINKANSNAKSEILPNGDMKIGQKQSARGSHHEGEVFITTGVNSITPANGSSVSGAEQIIKAPSQVPAGDHPEDTRNMRDAKIRAGIKN